MDMEKKTGSLALIFLLIILLGMWWVVSVFRFGSTTAPYVAQSNVAPSTSYTPPSPISITHTFSNGMEHYSGTLQLSECQDLQTGVTAAGVNPAHVKLLFTVTTPGSCVSHTVTPAPFAIAVSSKKNGSTVLDSVLVNNAAAAFSVVNAQ